MTQRMIGPALRRGTRGGYEEARNTSHVMDPDHPLYRGRFGPDSPLYKHPEEGTKTQEAWHKAQEQRRKIADVHRLNEEHYRREGKAFLKVGGVIVGTGGLTGLAARHAVTSDNRKMERQLGVRKAWSKDDPMMWHAEKQGDAHKVTIMGEDGPKAKRTRLGRLGRAVSGKNVEALSYGLLGAGTLAAVAPVVGPAKRNQDLERQVFAQRRAARQAARQAKQGVAKGRNPFKAQPYRGTPFVPKERPPKLPPEREWDGGRASHDKREAENKIKHDQKEKVATTPREGSYPWRGRPISEHWRDHIGTGQPRAAATSALLAGGAGGGVLLSQRQRKQKVAKEDAYDRDWRRGYTPAYHRDRPDRPGKAGYSQLRGKTALGKLPRVVELAHSGDPKKAERARKLLLPLGVRASVGKRDTRRDLETGAGAVAGAAAMDTLHTVGGQSAKAYLKERRNRRGTSPREEEAWGAHKQKMMGLKPGSKIPTDDSMSQSQKAKAFLHYPKGMPDWRKQRALGLKNTRTFQYGTLAAAAVGGGKWAHDRGQVTKMDPSDLPRAARRAAKKGRVPLTPEEIAARRAEAAERAKTKPPKPQQQAAPAGPPPPDGPRPRSSFLGRKEIINLGVGGTVGTGALYYGTRSPKQTDAPVRVGKKDNRKRNDKIAAGAGAVGLAAHVAERDQYKRGEREVQRVITANNMDGIGVGDFHPDQPRIDRGIHAWRAVDQYDNAAKLRGVKSAATLVGAGALLANRRKKVEKKDNDRQRVAIGAAGGAALADAADVITGASLKRLAVVQRDWKKKSQRASLSGQKYEDWNKGQNTILREHGEKHGLVDDRGRGRAPKPEDPHKVKNAYYRGYPTAIAGGRTQRLNALRDKKTPQVLAGGALLGGLASMRRQKVEKRNNFAVAGSATGAGALGAYAQARRSGNREEAKEVAGAALGGWAGQGLYQGAGYGYRNAVRGINGSKVPRHELPHLDPKTDFPNDPKGAELRRKNQKEREQLNRHHPRKADQKRNTPKHWHGSRMERIVGRTHGGKTGQLLGAAATGGGVLLGAELASSKKRPWQDEKVRKAYVPNPEGIRGPVRTLTINRRAPKRLLTEIGGGDKKRVMIVRPPDVPLADGKTLMRSKERDQLPATTPALRNLKRRYKMGVGQAKDLELPGGGVMRAGKRTVPKTMIRVRPEDLHGDFRVAKSREYGYMERKRNRGRHLQAGTGVAVGAWGASRLQVGRQVDRGVKYAEAKGYGDDARGAVNIVRRGRDTVRRGTGKGEAFLRGRIPGFGTALETIPAKLRPAAATAGGALLVARAHPLHDERFTPTGSW